MNARDAIKVGMDMAEYVSLAYVSDLNAEQFLHRPCQGTNHITWQIGHLIASEHEMIQKVCPGFMPELPAGFAAKYTKETAGLNDVSKFHSKDELLSAYRAQRAGTLAALQSLTDADLDRATGVDYAPTVAAMFSMQGSHWLMHAGQWVIIRRQHGLPPLF